MPTIIEGIKFYTVPDAAKALQVTAQTIRVYIRKGRLKSQRIGKPKNQTNNHDKHNNTMSKKNFTGGLSSLLGDQPEKP